MLSVAAMMLVSVLRGNSISPILVAELTAETRLREDLAFTSFDLAELTVKIEDEFDIDIFEDGLVNTIGEIYAKLS